MDKKQVLIELGERVRNARYRTGLSQTELANNIGKDQPSINRLETGKINPSYIYLLEVCQGLEITLGELLQDRE